MENIVVTALGAHPMQFIYEQNKFFPCQSTMPSQTDRCRSSGRPDFNSFPHRAAYMRQWIRSALVQIMACPLEGAKPLSEPMLEYC